MTASQPPQPPPGGQPPERGYQPELGRPPASQPPGFGQQTPGYGQGPPGYAQQPPPGYGPPPGHQQGPPSTGFGHSPGAPNPVGLPADRGGGFSFDPTKLTMADYGVAGGTLLYLILAFLPWFVVGEDFFSISLSGFDSGNVTTAFVLLLLATAWALLPAFVDLKLGFPRSWGTVGLAGLAWLLTLFAWIASFDGDFSIWALLGFLTATAILVFAVLALLPELRNRPALPGGLEDAAQWANQPAPDFGQQSEHGPPAPQHYAPPHPYAPEPYAPQPYAPEPYAPQPYAQRPYAPPPVPRAGGPAVPPPPHRTTQPYAPPPSAPQPPAPGGSTASGEGQAPSGG